MPNSAFVEEERDLEPPEEPLPEEDPEELEDPVPLDEEPPGEWIGVPAVLSTLNSWRVCSAVV